MNVFKILLATCLMGISGAVMAQDNVALPFLQLNPDVRTAGMGNITIAGSNGSFIYSDPTATLNENPGKLSASYSIGIYPASAEGRQLFNTLSLSYRLDDRHAILAGARLLNGLSVDIINGVGQIGSFRPTDYSLDLGYAFSPWDRVSIYGIGSYINAYNGATAHVALLSVGAYYRDATLIANQSFNYQVGGSVDHVGTKVRYGSDGVGVQPPSSIRISASTETELSCDAQLGFGVATRYIFARDNAHTIGVSAGTELLLWQTLALRAGYHAQSEAPYGSLGLGFQWRGISFDVAYLMPVEPAYRSLRIGLGINF